MFKVILKPTIRCGKENFIANLKYCIAYFDTKEEAAKWSGKILLDYDFSIIEETNDSN